MPEKAKEKKLSPKAKESRNVDPGLVTTWVPLDSTPEENERLQKVARHRNLKLGALLANALASALDAVRAEFDADAAAWDAARPAPKELSVEDAKAALAKAEAKFAAVQAQLDAAVARRGAESAK